jgi:hypothetical protein
MDIAAIFRGDHFRVVFGIAFETPETALRLSYKARLAETMRPADLQRFAIVAACGHNRVATQDEEQMHITAIFRIDCCRVALQKSPKSPGNSSANARTRKKLRGSDPSRGEKTGKTQISTVQDRPRMHRSGRTRSQNGRVAGPQFDFHSRTSAGME